MVALLEVDVLAGAAPQTLVALAVVGA